MSSLGEDFWVPHEHLCFVPCKLEATSGSNAIFKCPDDAELTFPQAKLTELDKVYDQQLEGIANIVDLEEVNPAALLHTIRTRYLREDPLIYTRVSRIVIAVNPFQALPLYTCQIMHMYQMSNDSMALPPHLFAIGADAINGLRDHQTSQAVLISGESGAGKTESTKVVLSYMTETLSSSESNMQEAIMQTNPILESFGNAMTVRNNNSSRFGKWLQMNMLRDGTIQDCSITNYLLETSRVIIQTPQERNYHVFFQLIHAREELKDLRVQGPEFYRYTKSGQLKAPGVDDGSCFEELKIAFSAFSIDVEEQMDIFAVVVGILELGNSEFKKESDENDVAVLEDDMPLLRAASLLRVDVDQLKLGVLKRFITVGGERTVIDHKVSEAEAARDALAKMLYNLLFAWMIQKINRCLADPHSSCTDLFFGILDIYGFETFETNSLEQVFINLSNEHLQNFFNNHVFKLELDDYKAEGLADKMDDVSYVDNSGVISLVTGKGGILSILDSEITVPKATDVTFVRKLYKSHAKNAAFVQPKFLDKSFGIRHFAGEVMYDIQGFLEKNTFKFSQQAVDTLQESKNSVAQEIAEQAQIAIEAAKHRGSASSQYTASLAELLKKLSATEPHFVRCIKSNSEKVPRKMESAIVMEQLKTGGVLEAVRIRKRGFALRIPFDDFISRYRVVVPSRVQSQVFGKEKEEDPVQRSKLFIEALPDALQVQGFVFKENHVMLGRTKTFVKSELVSILDQTKQVVISQAAADIMRIYRGFLIRNSIRVFRKVLEEWKDWHRDNEFYEKPGFEHTALYKWKTVEAIEEQLVRLHDIVVRFGQTAQAMNMRRFDKEQEVVENMKRRMQREIAEYRVLKQAMTSVELIVLEKALIDTKALDFQDLPETKKVEERLRDLKFQVPLTRALKAAMEIKDLDECQQVLDLVKKSGLHNTPQHWIKELEAQELLKVMEEEIEKQTKEAAEVKAAEEAAAKAAEEAEAKVAEEAKARAEEEAKAKAAEEANKQEAVSKQQTQQSVLRKVTFDNPTSSLTLPVRDASPHSDGEADAMSPVTTRKTARMSKRGTVTGLPIAGQQKILIGMMQACKLFDVDGLETGLKDALEEGIPENETLVITRTLLENLTDGKFVIAEIGIKTESLRTNKQNYDLIKAMQSLLRAADKLHLKGPAVEAGRQALQIGARERARHTITGRVFEDLELDERVLLDNAFSDLFKWQGLKDPDAWEGLKDKSGWFFTRSLNGRQVMLVHSKLKLKASLTRMEHRVEVLARHVFKDILMWMGDLLVSEVQRVNLLHEIVKKAADPTLTNEVYVQLMKQLTSNPSQRSMHRGWELMVACCQSEPPHGDLLDYVKHFLLRSVFDPCMTLTVQESAKLCTSELNRLVTRTSEIGKITVPVRLIGQSSRKVHVPTTTTIEQLIEIVGEQFRIDHISDFACFDAAPGSKKPKPLDKSRNVSEVVQQWARCHSGKGEEPAVLFKRSLLLRNEVLPPDDPAYCILTYRQALETFLSSPVTVSEKEKILVRTAAAILWVDRDAFTDYLSHGGLAQENVLEQLVPAQYASTIHRAAFSKLVYNQYTYMQATIGQEKPSASMGRALYEMQGTQLFGCYSWTGKQISQLPEGVSPDELPAKTCVINSKDPWWERGHAHLTLCVESNGLHLISLLPNSPVHRTFYFNKDAADHVESWAVREGVLFMCVRDKENNAPMSVLFEAEDSEDMEEVLDLITAARKQRSRQSQ